LSRPFDSERSPWLAAAPGVGLALALAIAASTVGLLLQPYFAAPTMVIALILWFARARPRRGFRCGGGSRHGGMRRFRRARHCHGGTELSTGLVLGATIHDVAQVAGAGYGVSESVGNTAVIVKLFRVFLLLPVVLAVGWYFARTRAMHARVALPGFALAFLVEMDTPALARSVGKDKNVFRQCPLLQSVFGVLASTIVGTMLPTSLRAGDPYAPPPHRHLGAARERRGRRSAAAQAENPVSHARGDGAGGLSVLSRPEAV
jgi:hypothetical protein